MKQGVKKITAIWTVVLKPQDEKARENAILQVIQDFYSSSNNELQRDLDNDDYDDVNDLRKNIKIYTVLMNTFKRKATCNKSDLKIASEQMLIIYEYYERKYINEVEHRNEEKRKNYVETILSPLMFVSEYFDEISN